MSDEKFSGVETLLERMNTHPEEFFESGEKRGRWSFMYKDYFKDSMTESEKGRLHEALRKVRRLEFDALVVKELMKEEQKEESWMTGGTVTLTTSRSNGTSDDKSGWWNSPIIKREGGKV